MNRCQLLFGSLAATTAVALLPVLAGLPLRVLAQDTVRQFPADVKRGMFVVTAPPIVQVDGAPARLSPGARIHGPNNMLVMSGTLVGLTLPVNYQRDGLGQLTRVWILNAAEQDALRVGIAPMVNFIFGSSPVAPKTDDGKTPFDQLPKYQAKP